MQSNKPYLVITPQATHELQNIAQWYEEKAPYLGDRFLEAVNESLKKILESPTAFAYHKTTKLRRYILPHFPYRIFYLIDGTRIKVIDVIHTSRSKKYIRRRLR